MWIQKTCQAILVPSKLLKYNGVDRTVWKSKIYPVIESSFFHNLLLLFLFILFWERVSFFWLVAIFKVKKTNGLKAMQPTRFSWITFIRCVCDLKFLDSQKYKTKLVNKNKRRPKKTQLNPSEIIFIFGSCNFNNSLHEFWQYMVYCFLHGFFSLLYLLLWEGYISGLKSLLRG